MIVKDCAKEPLNHIAGIAGPFICLQTKGKCPRELIGCPTLPKYLFSVASDSSED